MITGRADFGGIDNAALDFSQLEDYINDDEDNQSTMYDHLSPFLYIYHLC